MSVFKKIKDTFFQKFSNSFESKNKEEIKTRILKSESFMNFKEVPKQDEDQVKKVFKEVFKDVDGFASADFFDDEDKNSKAE